VFSIRVLMKFFECSWQLTPEQAKELGIEMRSGKDKPTLESEYEVTTLHQCILLLVSYADASRLHVKQCTVTALNMTRLANI